ncbi:hypothetical protein ACA910_002915 [Epithemia clementina (nom. ined.)]
MIVISARKCCPPFSAAANGVGGLVLLWLLTTATTVAAVKYGDEEYGDDEYGKFWAFHSKGVSVINPDTCLIETTVSQDGNGNALPTAWFDAIYMELSAAGEEAQGYVGINSAIPVDNDSHGQSTGAGEVLFFSTKLEDRTQPVVSRVVVGPRPVHSYAVKIGNEVEYWSHSDADGHFYSINAKDLSRHTGNPVEAHVETPAHGKLLWDEDNHLQTAGPNGDAIGFATSTAETHMFVLDLTAETLLTTLDFSNDTLPGTCSGTHAISYSDINKHAYLECAGPGGVIEINVADPMNPVFVAQFQDVSGALFETPDEKYIVSTNSGGNALHVFTPQGNGQPSIVSHNIDVPGKPATPAFWPDGDGSFTVCMPLTENTNKNHMNAAGDIVCDFSGCSGATSEEDVANGVCLYDDTGLKLLTVNSSQMDTVKSEQAPFNSACKNCEIAGNYDEDTNLCTCTPECGSCAKEDYDATNSGSRCVKLSQVLDGTANQATLIKGGGAVKQGSPYAYSPECGFGRSYRDHKRGHIYDASVANIPKDSIVILDMRTEQVRCHVELPGTPSKVTYVPTGGSERTEYMKARAGGSDDGLSGGAIAGIVVGGVAFLALAAYCLLRRGGNQKEQSGAAAAMEDSKDIETSQGESSNNDMQRT